jgi:L-fuconolactonase
MTIIDAHHHLWDPAAGDYPWMTGRYEPLQRPYTIADLRPHLAAAQGTGPVVVQARADPAETAELLAIAARHPVIRGVVGWVDLNASTIADQVSALRALPGSELLVGLRHDASSEPDPRWLTRPAVQANVHRAGELGLAFDLEITTREIEAAAELAERQPQVRFVVDHAAKPPIAVGWSQTWAAGLARLATSANTWCKVSGLVTEADWADWRPRELAPYVDHVVSAFGAGRVLFGSDWPVCELAASYERVRAATTDCLQSLTPDDLDAVMHRNAIACYRLGAAPALE